jgi:hypothetical protein
LILLVCLPISMKENSHAVFFVLAGFNTAKLFADYQYLMKVWTVRVFFVLEDFRKMNLIPFKSIHGCYDHILLIVGKNNRRKMRMI